MKIGLCISRLLAFKDFQKHSSEAGGNDSSRFIAEELEIHKQNTTLPGVLRMLVAELRIQLTL